MLKSKFGSKTDSQDTAGQALTGRAVAKAVGGGYIIEVANLPEKRGYMPMDVHLRMGSEILVRVMGRHEGGLPLLHPVFAGFAR